MVAPVVLSERSQPWVVLNCDDVVPLPNRRIGTPALSSAPCWLLQQSLGVWRLG